MTPEGPGSPFVQFPGNPPGCEWTSGVVLLAFGAYPTLGARRRETRCGRPAIRSDFERSRVGETYYEERTGFRAREKLGRSGEFAPKGGQSAGPKNDQFQESVEASGRRTR